MTDSSKQLTTMALPFKSQAEFVSYLKKMSVIQSDLLLEIDLSEGTLLCTTHNQVHSIVKRSSISLDNIFDTDDLPNEGIINIGIYKVSRLLKAFDTFNGAENMSLNLGLKKEKTKNSKIDAQTISIRGDVSGNPLEIRFACAKPDTFVLVPDNAIESITDMSEVLFSVDISKVFADRLSKLLSIDDDSPCLVVSSDGEKVTFTNSRSMFSLEKSDGVNIVGEADDLDLTVRIKKADMSCLDNDDYVAHASPLGLLFMSQDSDSFVMVSMALEEDSNG